MGSVADKFALLRRTKAGQKALLEKMYPDLDFSTIPFREYGRLFTGRAYVPGFVGGWKSYGRSNAEDASTRDILPDYSGNGRDIKLYNFDFAGKSGWGGYAIDFNSWVTPGSFITIESGGYKAVLTKENVNNYGRILGPENLSSEIESITVKVSGVEVVPSNKTVTSYKYFDGTDNTLKAISFNKSGVYKLPKSYAAPDEYTGQGQGFYAYCYAGITIEQLPIYPGGLVSDGVDDYGQCVKGFSLPDDFTIVAIRELLNSDGVMLSKTSTNLSIGAFLFEQKVGCTVFGFGNQVTFTPLFSWMSKYEYSGQQVNAGPSTDSSEYPLILLKRNGGSEYKNAALYDLRIYDHSLTDSELEAVKNEMMSDFIEGTGLLDDLNYVADWDAAGKSNEDADRDKWVDKLNGKVITLNNYSFAEMSGWNGYGIDLNKMNNINSANVFEGNKYIINKISRSILTTLSVNNKNNIKYKIRVSGLEKIINQGFSTELAIYFKVGTTKLSIKKDGIYDVNLLISDNADTMYWYVPYRLENSGWGELPTPIIIEQLPLYVGLCSDGVDDYGVTDEAITEEVGTMLCRLEDINTENSHYFLNGGSGDGRLYIWKSGGNIGGGIPTSLYKAPYISITRTPIAFNDKLFIASSGVISLSSNSCFSRLILLKDQLSDVQIEALKWKVEKEYNDYLKSMGWNNQ